MTDANSYRYMSDEDLRSLCEFKDGTIEILQRTLYASCETVQMLREELVEAHDRIQHLTTREYFYCEVTFHDESVYPNVGRYIYHTGYNKLKVGDKVLVPFEYDSGHTGEAVATVVSLLDHSDPSSGNKFIKTIIRKEENDNV